MASRSTQMCYWSTLGYNRRRWQLSGQAPREVMISVHGIMTTGECNELASRCDLGVRRAVGMVWYRYHSLKSSIDDTYHVWGAPTDSLGGRYTPEISVHGSMNSVLGVDTWRDFARKNTAHAWTDGPPPATFTVR